MALITCPECGRRITDQADFCVGCGLPMEKIRKIQFKAILSDKSIRCIVCGADFNVHDCFCQECRFPALQLSDGKKISDIIAAYRKENNIKKVISVENEPKAEEMAIEPETIPETPAEPEELITEEEPVSSDTADDADAVVTGDSTTYDNSKKEQKKEFENTTEVLPKTGIKKKAIIIAVGLLIAICAVVFGNLGKESEPEVEVPEVNIVYPDYDVKTVTVSTSDELLYALENAASGETIEIEPGEYEFNAPLIIDKGIKLKGNGNAKPIIKQGINIRTTKVMLENLAFQISSPKEAADYHRCIFDTCASVGRRTYCRYVDIDMEYSTKYFMYGISGESIYMEGCNVRVVGEEGGANCVSAHEGLALKNNKFETNDIAIGVYPNKSNSIEDIEVMQITRDNQFDASTKVVRYMGDYWEPEKAEILAE